MLDRCFPSCPVKGNLKPVPFEHLCSRGAVPRKCILCPYLFEGECMRVEGRYMHLDHGPCDVIDKEPSLIEIEKRRQNRTIRYRIPFKCEKCKHLGWDNLRLFYCRVELDVWGAFPRRLDFSGIEPKDIEPLQPLTLKITSGKGYEENAIFDAFEKAIDGFSIASQSTRFLMVIEGDGERMKIADINRIISRFDEFVSEQSEVLFGVYEIPGREDAVDVHIVQAH